VMVFMGGQGVGALLWGLVAGAIATPHTLIAAAALLLMGVASLPVLPLHALTGTFDRSVVTPWLAPEIGGVADEGEEPDPAAGPVVVEVSYRVVPERSGELLAALSAAPGVGPAWSAGGSSATSRTRSSTWRCSKCPAGASTCDSTRSAPPGTTPPSCTERPWRWLLSRPGPATSCRRQLTPHGASRDR
jgi:hypothetical protein